MSVVKMSKFKDMNMYKIEGEGFIRIKEKVDALSGLVKECEDKCEAAHKDLWDAIEEEAPTKKSKSDFALDREFEELGFYIIKKCKKGNLLDRVRKHLIED